MTHKFRIESCRSCPAPVVWARTVAGKPMPVNAAPDPLKGNIELSESAGIVRATIVGAQAERDDLHTSHFATCPNAGEWRTR